MDGSIVDLRILTNQVLKGEVTDEQVENLYGADTLRRVYDAAQEVYYGEGMHRA